MWKLIKRLFNWIAGIFLKLNIIVRVVVVILIFMLLYSISFKMARINIDKGQTMDIMSVDTGGEKTKTQEAMEAKKAEEAKKSLLVRFKESKKIYISDEETENIKISGETLEQFKRKAEVFVKVRNLDDDFKTSNKGYTDNSLNFKTDFNYFVITSGKRVENYKVPVSMKAELEAEYRKLIYTSVDFITNKENMGSIRIYHGDESKKVWPWKKDDLIYKILYKREVGKIQPEKEFKKSKDNYTIKMEKSGVKIFIQTMGKDFIKVTCGDNTAYYEVFPELYNYLHDEVFK
ncbi:hypothetical protein [Peptostreptococcus stomatis]|uniref:Uncharacterized protein n=2 Tax=Peptostreptococcus TaxID=1257 RepID=E0E1J4_9FIRM|nr:hypothetical protein [Peptostreptococcus stomatis]EFM65242.1 hypothetical protein HMPREF0634_0177 [Peptostreptococcus stomatis DSM 17678]